MKILATLATAIALTVATTLSVILWKVADPNRDDTP